MRIRYLWFTVPAAAVAGTVFYYVKKKRRATTGGTASARSGSFSPDIHNPPCSMKEASYSFISGFKDAVTVNMKFSYDAEKFGFSVSEDEFLAESGDSHVGILSGENFSAQIEYASYYNGEDFNGLRREFSGKYPDLSETAYGTLSGIRFRDGDNLCLAFPIPEDAHSYILITLVKAPDNDDELEALLDYPELRAILSSVCFSRN